MPTYRLGTDEFIIEDYHRTRPFSSFLPGIAGLWGIPMWVFYVNRGQAIAGFGIQDKEHPIMEFLPANRAYRATPLHGFRTFLKFSGRAAWLYEPFGLNHRDTSASSVARRMRIRMHDLVLEETHRAFGLETRVHYFTIPQEPLAALARVVSITNRSRASRPLELLDGLPVIIPYGMLDRFL
ncbi:MAG: cellobiose phosphorylase, partial [Candidatus Omnitrophica bacterium]|nr:cellobiose phosphorylase [Candidatus Omnitrophota bacterium]